tara:strand:- start:59 stop:370 length:312 start_codon:yes stop_codon:yes gene_type:complete
VELEQLDQVQGEVPQELIQVLLQVVELTLQKVVAVEVTQVVIKQVFQADQVEVEGALRGPVDQETLLQLVHLKEIMEQLELQMKQQQILILVEEVEEGIVLLE